MATIAFHDRKIKPWGDEKRPELGLLARVFIGTPYNMATIQTGQTVLLKQAIGFTLLTVLVWIVELIHLPHLFFGEPPEFYWPRVLFRTGIILAIWLWVYLTTKRLLKRLRKLEEFLLICSWCRKVGHDGKWLTTEDYFGQHFSTETSHGICPDCAKNISNNFEIKLREAQNAGEGI